MSPQPKYHQKRKGSRTEHQGSGVNPPGAPSTAQPNPSQPQLPAQGAGACVPHVPAQIPGTRRESQHLVALRCGQCQCNLPLKERATLPAASSCLPLVSHEAMPQVSALRCYLVSAELDGAIHYHGSVMNYNRCCSLPQRAEQLVTESQMGTFSLLSPFSRLSIAAQMGSKSPFSRILCKANQGRGINCDDDSSPFRWAPRPCPEELPHCL